MVNLNARRKVVDLRRQALQDHLKDAKALFEQGVVARNDLLRTEVALREVDDAGRTLDNALASARGNLNIALGLAPETAQTLPEALPPPPALPWDEAQVRTKAPASNVGVKALEAKLKAAGGQVDFRKKDFMPNVVAQLGHSYEENQFLVHPDQTTLYVGLSWKIFDGGARTARVSKSRAEEDSARRELVEARRQAENVAAGAYRDFKEALAEMETAKANVDAAQENLRIVTEQYQQAYAKSADVLDAETVLAESRFSLSDRLCRAYGQQAGLLALLGEDMEAFYATSSLEH
jgi:outer membrane protein TolC